MPSITTWTRLEPRSRTADMSGFLQARIADPLWALAVQYRIGEFVGQDAAFPIAATCTVTVRPLVAGTGSDDPQLPMDALAEAEPVDRMNPVDQAASLAEFLDEFGVPDTTVDAICAAFPYTPGAGPVDPQGASFLALIAGRLPDAVALEPLLREAIATGVLPVALDVPAAEVPAVLGGATAWLATVDSQLPNGLDTWQPSTLEHDLSVPVLSPAGQFATAEVANWSGSDLDWFDLDLVAGGDGRTGGPVYPASHYPPSGTAETNGIPHPLTFPGAPDPRYWAMEDSAHNFADVEVGTADLARMLVVEFALTGAPNWYLMPLTLPVGAVYEVDLTVSNTFGESVSIPMLAPAVAGSAPDWVMFRPSVDAADGHAAPLNGLLVPSLTADRLHSSPIESVALVRDEVFDRGWALEQVVGGRDGRAFDRTHDSSVLPAPTVPAADDGTAVHYLLESKVPGWAFPLSAADSSARRLRLELADPATPPLGEMLNDLRGQLIQQEQIPPWQATLRREARMARGPDGQLLTWTARVYRAGGNARSVPLDFDQVVGNT